MGQLSHQSNGHVASSLGLGFKKRIKRVNKAR